MPVQVASLSGAVEKEGQPVEGEAEELHVVPLRLAMEPRGHLVGHAGLAEADPGKEALGEARPLRQPLQRLDHAPADQPEVARALGQRRLGESLEQPVEAPREAAVGAAVGRAVGALAIDHVVSLRAIFATKSGIVSGGCCRSASIITTACPRALSRPAASATSLPKLRLNETQRMRGSAAARPRMTASVPSRLPSSTNKISCEATQPASTPVTRSAMSGALRSSLRTGTTIVSSGGGVTGSGSRAGRAGHFRHDGPLSPRACP